VKVPDDTAGAELTLDEAGEDDDELLLFALYPEEVDCFFDSDACDAACAAACAAS
jgi:hypothetical protein